MKLYIIVKKSRKTGLIYWVMTGANGEKMSHSEGYDNRAFVKKLMKRFELMGFVIDWQV